MLETAGLAFEAAAAPAASGGVRPVAARGLRVERRGRMLLDVAAFSVASEGVTALMGPNGAGKSLLLRCLAGLVTPDAGEVGWAGAPPDRVRASRLGFVFQKPVLLRRSARANIRHALSATGVRRGEARERADRALAEAGISHLSSIPARLLSGGEQQRLAIARALALRPECLFLDEPTANLDPASVAAIEATALNAGARGVSVVFVTHDPAQARRVASRVVFMNAGLIVEDADADRFFTAPQSAAGAAFLAGRLLTG